MGDEKNAVKPDLSHDSSKVDPMVDRTRDESGKQAKRLKALRRLTESIGDETYD